MTDQEFFQELDRRVEEDDSSLMRHAKKQLDSLLKGNDDWSDCFQRIINRGILRLVYIFDAENHSGTTAGWSIQDIYKLLRYKPLREEVQE